MASQGDLYVNGQFHDDGDPIRVNGMEPDKVNCNGLIVWEKDAYVPPDPDPPPCVCVFSASDNKCDYVEFFWDPVEDATSYDVHNETWDSWLYNVTEGQNYNMGAAGTWTFRIYANGPGGTTRGEEDYGTQLDCGTPPGDTDEIFDTVGCSDWVCPSGVTSVVVCMVGGGGSGGASLDGWDCGGGVGGTIKSQTVSVSAGTTYRVCVGAGGAKRLAVVGAPNWVGNNGASSKFGSITANGGAGGEVWQNADFPNYPGNGGSRSTCMGTFYDGNYVFSGRAWGGQAGFAGGTNGSYHSQIGASTLDGSKGSGSGGASGNNVYMEPSEYSESGKGGDGYVKITY